MGILEMQANLLHQHLKQILPTNLHTKKMEDNSRLPIPIIRDRMFFQEILLLFSLLFIIVVQEKYTEHICISLLSTTVKKVGEQITILETWTPTNPFA